MELAAAEDGQVQSDSIRVIDMGTHLLSKLTGARLVVQLLIPGLEERARALPPLCSLHHTPGIGLIMPLIVGLSVGLFVVICCSADK